MSKVCKVTGKKRIKWTSDQNQRWKRHTSPAGRHSQQGEG